jgi:hypothetical protein
MDTSAGNEEEARKEDRMKPINERYMIYSSKRYTICQMLREIYQLTDNPEIRLKCRIASRMSKCMAKIITEYKGEGWEDNFWPLKENADEGYPSSGNKCQLR